jgi:hypothetical protein
MARALAALYNVASPPTDPLSSSLPLEDFPDYVVPEANLQQPTEADRTEADGDQTTSRQLDQKSAE